MIEKIINKIHEEQDDLMDSNGNFASAENEGAYNALCDLEAYIDSLAKESVSEDLEEAAEKYAKENYPDEVSFGQFGTSDYEPYINMSGERERAVDDFKSGASWQKWQTINKACEWLLKNIRYYSTNALGAEYMCNDFREAMEE